MTLIKPQVYPERTTATRHCECRACGEKVTVWAGEYWPAYCVCGQKLSEIGWKQREITK